MDVYPNGPVSGGHLTAGRQPETTVPSMASSSIQGGFLTGEIEEGGDDMSLQWLSMFVEDCLSAAPILYPTTSHHHHPPPITTTLNPPTQAPNPVQPSPHEPTIPSKARTKRRKLNSRTHHQAFHVAPPDPPLLHQTHWLADSELIFPKKEHEDKKEEEEEDDEERVGEKEGGQQQLPRRCTHCQSHRTPQWRGGPLGPKTLCNACGVRFKSGRLLPEYRPAKSPTFVSYKHSNSHKKVMEMRMSLLPSHSK